MPAIPNDSFGSIDWRTASRIFGLDEDEFKTLSAFVEGGRVNMGDGASRTLANAVRRVIDNASSSPSLSSEIFKGIEFHSARMRQRGQTTEQIASFLGFQPAEMERYINRGIMQNDAIVGGSPYSGEIRRAQGTLGQNAFVTRQGIETAVDKLQRAIDVRFQDDRHGSYIVEHEFRDSPIGGHALIQVHRMDNKTGDISPVGERFRLTSFDGEPLFTSADGGNWYKPGVSGVTSGYSSVDTTIDRLADGLAKHIRQPRSESNTFARSTGINAPGNNNMLSLAGDLPTRFSEAGREGEMFSGFGASKFEAVGQGYTYGDTESWKPISLYAKTPGFADVEGEIFYGGGKFGKNLIKRGQITGVRPQVMLGHTHEGRFQELPLHQQHVKGQEAKDFRTGYRRSVAMFVMSDPLLGEGMQMMDPGAAPVAAERFEQSPEKWTSELPSRVTADDVRKALGLDDQGHREYRSGQRIKLWDDHQGISFGNWEKAYVTGFEIGENDQGRRTVTLQGHREVQSQGNIADKAGPGVKHFSTGGSPRENYGLDVDIAMSSPSNPMQAMFGVLSSLDRPKFEDYWRRANTTAGGQLDAPPPSRFAAGVETKEQLRGEYQRWLNTWKLYLDENVKWDYVTPPQTLAESSLKMFQQAGRIVGEPELISSDRGENLYRVSGVKSPYLQFDMISMPSIEMSNKQKGFISFEEGEQLKEAFSHTYGQLQQESERFRQPYRLLGDVYNAAYTDGFRTGSPVLDLEKLSREGGPEWAHLQKQIADRYNAALSKFDEADFEADPNLKTKLARQARADSIEDIYGSNILLKYGNQYIASPATVARFGQEDDITGTMLGRLSEKTLEATSAMFRGGNTQVTDDAIRAQTEMLNTFSVRKNTIGINSERIVGHAYGSSSALRPNEVASSTARVMRMFGVESRNDERWAVLEQAIEQGILRESGFRAPGVNPKNQMDIVTAIVGQKELYGRAKYDLGDSMSPIYSEAWIMAQGGDADSDYSRGFRTSELVEGTVPESNRIEGWDYSEIRSKGKVWTVVNPEKVTSAAEVVRRAKVHEAGEYQGREEAVGVSKTFEERFAKRFIPTIDDLMEGMSKDAFSVQSFDKRQTEQIQIGQVFNLFTRGASNLAPENTRSGVMRFSEHMYQRPLDANPWEAHEGQGKLVGFLSSFDLMTGHYYGKSEAGKRFSGTLEMQDGSFLSDAADKSVGYLMKMIIDAKNEGKDYKGLSAMAAGLLTPSGGDVSIIERYLAKGGNKSGLANLLSGMTGEGEKWSRSDAAFARLIRGQGMLNAVKNLQKISKEAYHEGSEIPQDRLFWTFDLDQKGGVADVTKVKPGTAAMSAEADSMRRDYDELLDYLSAGAKGRESIQWLPTGTFINNPRFANMVNQSSQDGLNYANPIKPWVYGESPSGIPLLSAADKPRPQTVTEQVGTVPPLPHEVTMPYAQESGTGITDRQRAAVLGKGAFIGGKWLENLSAAPSNADISEFQMLQRQVERVTAMNPNVPALGESIEATIGTIIQERTQKMVYDTVRKNIGALQSGAVPRLEAGENWLSTVVEHGGEEFIARSKTPFVRTRKDKEGNVSGIDFIRMTTSTSDDWSGERGAFITAKMLKEGAARGMLPYLSTADQFEKHGDGYVVGSAKKFNLRAGQMRYAEIRPDAETTEIVREARKQLAEFSTMVRAGKDLYGPGGEMEKGTAFHSNQVQFIHGVLDGLPDATLARYLNDASQVARAKQLVQAAMPTIDQAGTRYAKRMVEMTTSMDQSHWRRFDDETFERDAQQIIGETRTAWRDIAGKSLPHVLPIVEERLRLQGAPPGYHAMSGLIKASMQEAAKPSTRLAKGGISAGAEKVVIGDNPSGIEFVVPSEKAIHIGGGLIAFDPQSLGRKGVPMGQRKMDGDNPLNSYIWGDEDEREIPLGGEGRMNMPPNPLKGDPVFSENILSGNAGEGGGGGIPDRPFVPGSEPVDPNRPSAGVDPRDGPVINYAQPLNEELIQKTRALLEFERSIGPRHAQRLIDRAERGVAPRKGSVEYEMAVKAAQIQPRLMGEYHRAMRNIHAVELMNIRDRGVTPGMQSRYRDVLSGIASGVDISDIGVQTEREYTPEQKAEISRRFQASDAGQTRTGRALSRQFDILGETVFNRGITRKDAEFLGRQGTISHTEYQHSLQYRDLINQYMPDIALPQGVEVRGIDPYARDKRTNMPLHNNSGQPMYTYLGGEHPDMSDKELRARYGGEGVEDIFGAAVSANRAYSSKRIVDDRLLSSRYATGEAGVKAYTESSPLYGLAQIGGMIQADKLQGNIGETALKQLQQRLTATDRMNKLSLLEESQMATGTIRKETAEQYEQTLGREEGNVFYDSQRLRGNRAQASELFGKYVKARQDREALPVTEIDERNRLADEMNQYSETIKSLNLESKDLKSTVSEHRDLISKQNVEIERSLKSERDTYSAAQVSRNAALERRRQLEGESPKVDRSTEEGESAWAAYDKEKRAATAEYRKAQGIIERSPAIQRDLEAQKQTNLGILDALDLGGATSGQPAAVQRQLTPRDRFNSWASQTFSSNNLFYGLQNMEQMKYMFQMPLDEKRQQYLNYEFSRGQTNAILGAGGPSTNIARFQAESAAGQDFDIAFGRGVNAVTFKGMASKALMNSDYGEGVASFLGGASQVGTGLLNAGMLAHMAGLRPENLGKFGGWLLGGGGALATAEAAGGGALMAGARTLGGRITSGSFLGTTGTVAGGILTGGALLGDWATRQLDPDNPGLMGALSLPGQAGIANAAERGYISKGYALQAVTSNPLETLGRLGGMAMLGVGQMTGWDQMQQWGYGAMGLETEVDPSRAGGYKLTDQAKRVMGGTDFETRLAGIVDDKGHRRLGKQQINDYMRSFGEATGASMDDLTKNKDNIGDLGFNIAESLLKSGLDPSQIDAAMQMIGQAPDVARMVGGGAASTNLLRQLDYSKGIAGIEKQFQGLGAVSGTMQHAGLSMDTAVGVGDAFMETARQSGSMFAAQRQLSALTGGTAYDYSDIARGMGMSNMALYDQQGRPMHQQQTWDIQARQMEYDFSKQQEYGQQELQWMEQRQGMEEKFWDFRIESRQRDFELNQRGMDLSIRQMELNLSRQDEQMDQSDTYQAERFAVQRQIFGLQTKWRREDFGIQRDRMETRRDWQLEDFSRQESGMNLQRSWQLEDFEMNRNVNAMQFGWQMEDFDRNIRYASGRNRMDLMRQRDRAATMQGIQEQQMSIQERRAGIQYRRGREDLATQRGRAEQSYNWNVEDLDRSVSRFEEMLPLQEKMMALGEQYWQSQSEMQHRYAEENRAIAEEQIALMKDRKDDAIWRFNKETELQNLQHEFDLAQQAARKERMVEELAESERRHEERLQITEWQQEMTLAQQNYSMIQQQGWDYAAERSKEVLAIQKEIVGLVEQWVKSTKGQSMSDAEKLKALNAIADNTAKAAAKGSGGDNTMGVLSEIAAKGYNVE